MEWEVEMRENVQEGRRKRRRWRQHNKKRVGEEKTEKEG